MATIKRQERADGSVAYTTQVKLWREGKLVLTKAATFDRESTARGWAKRREAEFAEPGAVEPTRKPKGSLSDLIDRYLAMSRKEIGPPKAQVPDAIKKDDLAQLAATAITSADLVACAERSGATRQPRTVQNYLSHLGVGAVVAVARREMMRRAVAAGKRLKLVARSVERDRHPTMDGTR